MNLRMGSQLFVDVGIPLLWGRRAVVQDQEGALSVIDLSGPEARLEVLSDEPAPGIEFLPGAAGFAIRVDNQDLYTYSADTKTLTPGSLSLPEVQVLPTETRVGSNIFSGNVVSGFGVGIAVSEHGIAMGAPLPEGLAELKV